MTASIEMTAKVNVLQWFGHVLRSEEKITIQIALDFEVLGKRKKRTSEEHIL